MGKAVWQPKWWSPETHGSAWERVKEAMKRDWEQTKNDMKGTAGRDLDQDVGDTVKQAAGKQPIPPINQPNLGGTTARSWDDVEGPMSYGFGARDQYGAQFTRWDDTLENKLRSEWDETKAGPWQEVKDFVRRGYERSRS